MAKLSAYSRTELLRMELTIEELQGPVDKKRITYAFMSDRTILWKVSFYYPADNYRLKPKWESVGWKVRGKLKEGLDPRENDFYRKLLTKGYKEVSK